MITDWLLILGLLISLITAIVAVIALRENTKTQQLRIFSDSFNRTKETECLFYTHFKGKKKDKKDWYSIHFNNVELLSFFVNEEFIKDKKLVGFFRDAIMTWYEKMFITTYSKEEINDKNRFPEFKKLYHRIKYESLRKN